MALLFPSKEWLDALREELGTFLEEVLQIEYEQTYSAARDMLGKENFENVWAEGRISPLEQTIQFALSSE